MIDLSNTCIFSGTSDNLNTVMKVTVDGQEYKVAISEEFEEEASLGAIKKKIKEQAEVQQKKHDLLQQLADELGYDLSPGQGGLIIARPQEPERLPKEEAWPEASSSMRATPQIEPKDMPIVSGNLRAQKNDRQKKAIVEGLDKKEAEAALERATKRAAIGNGENVEAPPPGAATTRPAYHLPSSVTAKVDGKEVEVQAPKVTAKTTQVVEGVGGFPVKIDRSVSSRVGDTNIKVIRSVNDKDLINLTKQADATGGRMFSDCRACGGMGVHRMTGKECPRCEGTGLQI